LANVKYAEPHIYKGCPEKAKAWLVNYQLYFEGRDLDNSRQCIFYALAKIQDGENDIAGNWADARREEVFDESPDAIETWSKFRTDFLAYFLNSELAGQARLRLRRLTQGGLSVEEFTTTFTQLANSSGYNDVALLKFYKDKLNKGIFDRLVDMCLEDDLDEWKKHTISLDKNRRRE
jgi:hypothetical protein